MGQLHFQDGEQLHGQPISDEETRQIIALWAEEHDQRHRQSAQPTAEAISEALGIPPDEVRRLLARVRQRDAEVQATPHAVTHRKPAMSAGNRVVVILVAALALLLLIRAARFATTVAGPSIASAENYRLRPDGSQTVDGSGTHYVRNADGSVTLDTPQGHYERHADGSLVIRGSEGNYRREADGSIEISGPGGRYSRHSDGSEERTGNPPVSVTSPTPPSGVSLPEVP